MRRIDAGKLQAKIFDDGIQSRNYTIWHCSYRRGNYFAPMWDIITPVYVRDEILNSAGTYVGNRNWTDTLGNFWPYHVTGHGNYESIPDSNTHQFNVPDEMGFTIRRFFSYPPTQIIVDGQHMELPFGLLGDEVAPEKVWGTADVMVECHYRLSNGMDVYQRNLAWSQPGHDDYVIWDLTFINTGNTDADTLIELPGQNLDSVIITKHYDAMPNAGNYPFGSWAGVTENHNSRLSYPLLGDSLRINYIALARKAGHTHDSWGDVCELDWGGDPNLEDGCCWTGQAILFAPKNTKCKQTYPIPDIRASNDPSQPSMHSTIEGFGVSNLDSLVDTTDHREPYRCMRMGIHGYDDTTIAECQNVYDMNNVYDVYDTTAMGAPTYYDQPQDRMGELDLARGQIFPRNWDYYLFSTTPKFTIGPYNMEFGDTIRFVYAVVAGSIHRKTTYLLSATRASDSARYYEWVSGMDSATIRQEYEKRDPVAELYGDVVYMGGGLNEIATDYVISTGKDSLFNNGMAAQHNFNMNYNIPASPAPPSVFEVSSRPDMIELDWSYDPAYLPSDLAGFKIYRAKGGTEYTKWAGEVSGDWQLIDSVGPSERNYEDTVGLEFDNDYCYSITAVSTAGIESGRFLTMTTYPRARMTADFPGESLRDIRVVPNPLHIAKNEWLNESKHKIAFRKLPPRCTIRILTESGELISTITHDNLSGTEYWEEEWSLISSGSSRPASGIYIVHIQTPKGEWITRKFVIVR
jgi:hypothetical protein